VKEKDFLSLEETSRRLTEVSVRFAVSLPRLKTLPELITPAGGGPGSGARQAFAPTFV